jgi:hypothetical protein
LNRQFFQPLVEIAPGKTPLERQWLTPGSDGAPILPLWPETGGCALALTSVPVYSVVKISLR